MSEVTKHESDSQKKACFLLKRKTNQRKQLPRHDAMFWICLFTSLSVPHGCGRCVSSQMPSGRGLRPPEGTPAPLSSSTGSHTSPAHQPEDPGDTHHSWRKREPQELAPTCQTLHTRSKELTPAAEAQQAGGLYLLHLPRGRVSGPAEGLQMGMLAHQELN